MFSPFPPRDSLSSQQLELLRAKLLLDVSVWSGLGLFLAWGLGCCFFFGAGSGGGGCWIWLVGCGWAWCGTRGEGVWCLVVESQDAGGGE